MIDNWLGISQTDISIKLFKLVEIAEVLAYYYSFIYVIWQIVQIVLWDEQACLVEIVEVLASHYFFFITFVIWQIVLWDEQACLVEIVGVLTFGQSCTFSRDSWRELKQTLQS